MSEKEIIELVASIEAVKDFTKDVDVIFNFINEDDSKDKKIDALENVINSAMNYVKQFVSLDEDEIVEYTPILILCKIVGSYLLINLMASSMPIFLEAITGQLM